MTDLPREPVLSDERRPLNSEALDRFQGQSFDHERAVAVRAYDGLTDCLCRCTPRLDKEGFDSEGWYWGTPFECPRCVALRDIHASGWRP